MSVSSNGTTVNFTDADDVNTDAAFAVRAKILDAIISALDELGIEPQPNSVTDGGVTVVVNGLRFRIGFGSTMGY